MLAQERRSIISTSTTKQNPEEGRRDSRVDVSPPAKMARTAESSGKGEVMIRPVELARADTKRTLEPLRNCLGSRRVDIPLPKEAGKDGSMTKKATVREVSRTTGRKEHQRIGRREGRGRMPMLRARGRVWMNKAGSGRDPVKVGSYRGLGGSGARTLVMASCLMKAGDPLSDTLPLIQPLSMSSAL